MLVGGPATRQIGEGGASLLARHGDEDVVLLQARAGADRLVDALAGIDDEVLDLRQDAGVDVRIAVARHAAPGGAKAGKVVLLRIDVTPAAVAAAVGEEVGLYRHLEEGIVPPHAPDFAVALVGGGDVGKARVQI